MMRLSRPMLFSTRSFRRLTYGFVLSLAALVGCRGDDPTEPKLKRPNFVLIWPGAAIDQSYFKRVPDSLITAVTPPNDDWLGPDTMAVLAPGEGFRASARAYFRQFGYHSPLILNGVSQAIIWSSDNDAVASVDRKG